MKTEKVLYIGPTGLNPDLGHVITDVEIDIPVALKKKYLAMQYIEEIVKRKETIKK